MQPIAIFITVADHTLLRETLEHQLVYWIGNHFNW